MAFEIPKLPYEPEALDPVINKQTMEFHYGKHHQAYVNNLNNLIKGTKWENASLEEIIKGSDGGIFNNAAQVWNHTFYFMSFKSNGGGEPAGALADAINKKYGSFAEFKEQFSKAAVTLFGSGWAWLVKKDDASLEIFQKSNAGTPLTEGCTPILTCDVWEHAYYLAYQNRRPDYVKDFWSILDWEVIGKRF
ncbi:MAG: superoxide dismutase [Bacteroidales bacterium]|nr:superoxide dismutase [Bacteroidales bacterium]MBN2820599.1 superoxide dismutase [Bacteroidales bacterium]